MSSTVTAVRRPTIVGQQVLSEGNIETQLPLEASDSFISSLLTVDRSDGVLMAYAEADESGTLYVIFTDFSGENVVSVQPSSGLATSTTSAPSGSNLTGQNSAVIRSSWYSRYFYLFYVNDSTPQTLFELGWRSQTS